ncbi:MAG: hypothetical protein KDB24_09025, partial [Microthrixaceae bacterium]|nr:hypothetical protein [Microthrixaceae bacterium]
MPDPDDLAVELRQTMSDLRWELGLAPLSDADISGRGSAPPPDARPSGVWPEAWTGASGVDRPLALVGPTASGKTAVTLALADLVAPLEAVAADSMTVYRHMDV